MSEGRLLHPDNIFSSVESTHFQNIYNVRLSTCYTRFTLKVLSAISFYSFCKLCNDDALVCRICNGTDSCVTFCLLQQDPAVTMFLAAGEVSLGPSAMQITGQGYTRNWNSRWLWSSVAFKRSFGHLKDSEHCGLTHMLLLLFQVKYKIRRYNGWGRLLLPAFHCCNMADISVGTRY